MPRWNVVPPVDTRRAGPHRPFGWLLDAHAAEDRALVESIWRQHAQTIRGEARQIADDETAEASANIPIYALCAWIVATQDDEAWRLAGRLVDLQLSPAQPKTWKGLFAWEPLSPQYGPGVVAGLTSAFQSNPERGRAVGLDRWLEAAAYLLSLFAVPYGGPRGLTVVAPGARATPGNDGNLELSYVLAVLLESNSSADPRLRPSLGWGPNGQSVWPLRVMWAAGSPFGENSREMMVRAARGETKDLSYVEQELRDLGVTLRVPFHVERFANGELASWMGYPDRQSHVGATAARYAASYVGGKAHWLTLHPYPYNFADGRKVGKVHVDRDGSLITAFAQDSVGFTEEPPPGAMRRGDTFVGSIPAPSDAPIYRITIGPDGVSMGDDMPQPKPPRDDEDDDPGGDVEKKIERHLHAISDLLDDSPSPSDMARSEKHALAVARLRGWKRP